MEGHPISIISAQTVNKPVFAYDEEAYGLYHLAYESPCVDAGDDPNGDGTYLNETDIDDDFRVYDGDGDTEAIVDIGADEFNCEDVSDPNDLTADGVVNLWDFKIFSKAWLSDPAESNWDERCDIDGDDDVDIFDFRSFITNWLWCACWYEGYEEIWMMSLGGGESLSIPSTVEGMIDTFAVESTELLVPEKTFEEQLEEAIWLVARVEEIWEDPLTQEQIDKKDWKNFIDSLYEWIEELEEMTEDEVKEKL